MVAASTVTTRHSSIGITSKYWLLALVLLISVHTTVSAQEQNNPLLTEVIDKIQQLQNEIAKLRNQNELTQYDLETLRKNLDTQLTELKTRIDGAHTTSTILPRTVQTAPADDIRINQLMNNFQEINDKMDQANSRLDELVRAVETLQLQPPTLPETPAVETEQPVAKPETPAVETKQPVAEPETPAVETEQPVAEPEKTVPQTKTKVSPVKPAKLPNENEYAAYSRAMDALERADYTRLRDNLIRFLQDYPGGDYADDANYWIAESYHTEGNLELAESYFTQLLENYSESEKREPALLKIAYIRLNNQQWEAARKVLELLKNEAEDEQIRKLATEQLKRLESTGR